MAQYRNIEFRMVLGRGYGQYVLECDNYKGKSARIHTTDSQAYDALNDRAWYDTMQNGRYSERKEAMKFARSAYDQIRYTINNK